VGFSLHWFYFSHLLAMRFCRCRDVMIDRCLPNYPHRRYNQLFLYKHLLYFLFTNNEIIVVTIAWSLDFHLIINSYPITSIVYVNIHWLPLILTRDCHGRYCMAIGFFQLKMKPDTITSCVYVNIYWLPLILTMDCHGRYCMIIGFFQLQIKPDSLTSCVYVHIHWLPLILARNRIGCDSMVVGFLTNNSVSPYNH
jgi:hypothetical protein